MEPSEKALGIIIAIILIVVSKTIALDNPEFVPIELTLFIFSIILGLKLTFEARGIPYFNSIPYALLLAVLILVGFANALYAPWGVRLHEAVALACLALGGVWLWQLALYALILWRAHNPSEHRE